MDANSLNPDCFNLITSGCGTGKSYFCSHKLLELVPDVKPYEILFLTSRSITVDQMCQEETIDKFIPDKKELVRYWNSDDVIELTDIANLGIQVMTYDKIINILINQNTHEKKTLSKIKVVIVDECHTLFADTFIKDIEMLKVWIRDMLWEKEKIFIGLTATPGIVYYYRSRWGVKVHTINDKVLINYKAKQLTCITFGQIPRLFAEGYLKGKTIIMCRSIKDCYDLQAKLPNAAVIFSKQNPNHYTPEIDAIREHIVEHKTLPKYFIYVDPTTGEKERKALDILISTSTLREGFTLLPESGVCNVICCYTDELNITQFAGRCRFNIDNLVIAEKRGSGSNTGINSYFLLCNEDYHAFIEDSNNTKWFDSIAHLIAHDAEATNKLATTINGGDFIGYIDSNWVAPPQCSQKEYNRYKIYKDEDRDRIAQKAYDCGVLGMPRRLVTFNRVIHMLEGVYGYRIESGRFTLKGKKYTYKLILPPINTSPFP